ncbi:methyltransferase domain-containing protein [Actinomycetota bacterium]
MSIRKSDYENYDYREFWEDDKRYYEDQSERMALRSMLKGVDPSNKLFIDIGCGYARLFNEYSKFQRVVFIDYSMKNIKNAQERISRFLSDDPEKLSNILFISADATAIPIKDDSADTVLTVRVVHHLDKPEKYFDEVKRILKEGGLYLFEFANKRNLKNILRFMIGKMDTSPFGPVPSQVGETIRNYHPKEIFKKLKQRDIRIERIISVSNFRLGILKKIFGNKLLLLFENIYQKLFSFITWGPSIFIKGYLVNNTASRGRNPAEEKPGESENYISSDNSDQSFSDGDKKSFQDACRPDLPADKNTSSKDRKQFFRNLLEQNLLNFSDILICPLCHSKNLTLSGGKIRCGKCNHQFLVDGNIIDLKA